MLKGTSLDYTVNSAMKDQSMLGYFEYIKNKTYIDRYPETVINLCDLKDSVILELGSGVGNDIRFLVTQYGLKPKNIFSVESNISDIWIDLLDNLEELFGEYFHSNFFPRSILNNQLPGEFCEFVYANNFLHCLGYRTFEEGCIIKIDKLSKGTNALEKIISLEPKDKMRMTIEEVYRLLKLDGTFFGRTLSDYLDNGKLQMLTDKSVISEKEEFVIRTAKTLINGELIGISPLELENYGQYAGFRKVYTEIKPETWKPVRDFYFRFVK